MPDFSASVWYDWSSNDRVTEPGTHLVRLVSGGTVAPGARVFLPIALYVYIPSNRELSPVVYRAPKHSAFMSAYSTRLHVASDEDALRADIVLAEEAYLERAEGASSDGHAT